MAETVERLGGLVQLISFVTSAKTHSEEIDSKVHEISVT